MLSVPCELMDANIEESDLFFAAGKNAISRLFCDFDLSEECDWLCDLERKVAPYAEKLPEKCGLPADEGRHRFPGFLETDDSSLIDRAESLLVEPIPVAADELYLEYWSTGNRTRYQNVRRQLINNMYLLARAEEMEGRGRFIRRLENYITGICAMKSWVLPAHDWSGGGRGNYLGTMISVDLCSSELAAQFACIVAAVGERLSPDVVKLIKSECERRVFSSIRREMPFRIFTEGFKTVASFELHNWWMNCGNNWNSVCWDNTVCAALGLVENRFERALYVVAADRAADIYLDKGFSADGYCTEGMGYWNYGYGHHLKMGLVLRRVSGGKIDIFTRPKQRIISEYARSYTLREGASPAFADGNGCADQYLVDLADTIWPDLPKELPVMSEFAEGQVWLFRNSSALSVAIKGGNNGELHNHNDIGSYYVMDGNRFVAGDPGAEVYTARTFGPQRYESKVLNSCGHPVPVVGGKLQSTGSAYAAKILSKEFSAERSSVVLDIGGAYEVPTLKSLIRTFVYDRAANTFTVRDCVEFSEPTTFEDCYVTFGKSADVTIRPLTGGALSVREEIIDNPGKMTPHRFGYSFLTPITSGEIEFVFSGRPVVADAV